MAETDPSQAEAGAKEVYEVPMKTGPDPWDVKDMQSSEKPWSARNPVEKLMYVALQVAKGVLAVLTLYLFIISLSMMGGAFKILAGPTAGKVFRNNEIFDNPIAGLVIGVLVTVLVQSSSTSTSIIVTMTGADLIEVKDAIPMIMGANIGTSITNTIVSVAQIGDKDQYRRAFAGATVHDCFNFLTVAVLLPIEAITGMLRGIAMAIVDGAGIGDDTEKQEKVDFLKKVTKPVTSRLIQVDKKLVTKVAQELDPQKLETLLEKSMIVQSKDSHLFMDTPMNDTVAGVVLLFASLAFLTTCLILLVKLLQTIFRGRAAIWMRSLLNLEFKGPLSFLADYVLILFGIGITILMQSSSVTTSTLTPLVGIGLIKLEKMFPFTVGANIGTTVTGVLAAFASSNIRLGLQVALCHLLFNLIGTLIWFPIPIMRKVPVAMAKTLGNLAADLKWFPFAYLIVVFGIIPAILLALSLAGPAAVGVVGSLMLLAMVAAVALLVLRANRPDRLPEALRRDPAWLPESLRVDFRGDTSGNAGHRVSSADMGSEGMWKMAPAAWGLGWILLIMLVCAVPNAQWSNLKYPNFDKRANVGFGAWSACSAMFEKDMQFATLAESQARAACTQREVQECAAMKDCAGADFADDTDANEVYEDSWNNCTKTCSLHAWERECLSMGCGGEKHGLQCKMVTKEVYMEERSYPVEYKTVAEEAWKGVKGERCRPITALCDDDTAAVFGHAGNLAVIGTLCIAAAQALALAYQFMRTRMNMKPCLQASLATALGGWVFLFASWTVFEGHFGEQATCIVPDLSGVGVVTVTGAFKDITDGGGSYSFYFVVLAWALSTIMIAFLAHRVVSDLSDEKQILKDSHEPTMDI